MPEGDTIHRVATTLRPALVGHALTRVELPRVPRPHPRVGACITAVEARGKHLLVRSDDGLTVHTHLRMTGSWHLYGPGERWRKSARAVRVVLAVQDAVAVCFSAPIVEVLDDRNVRRHPSLRALGPDLCDPHADLGEATRRLQRLTTTGTTIGEALLDQRVASGVGNVYRCEVLFLHGLDPATPLEVLDPTVLRALLEDASRLLQHNLSGNARSTVPHAEAGALWVHGRGGEPCRRCGTAIEVLRLGEQARYVYRCPRCQPPQRPRPGTATVA